MAGNCTGWSFALALAVVATPALGQGTIIDHDAMFVRFGSCWDTTPSADLLGVSTPLTTDHLYEFGWWYRVGGDPQETALPVPDTQDYSGDHSVHTWYDVGGRGFLAEEETWVLGVPSGPPRGIVAATMTVINNGAVPLQLELFAMIDLDLAPLANDDAATLVEWTPNRVVAIADAGGNAGQLFADAEDGTPLRFLVRPNGANDVGALLSNSTITNFDDSGLPFGPADVTLGWQFSLSVSPGASRSAVVGLALNTPWQCFSSVGVFCDGFERGDRSLWSSSAP